MGEWVATTERLPPCDVPVETQTEIHGKVVTCSKIFQGYLLSRQMWCHDDGTPTDWNPIYWRPLSESRP
jgi:hypothetical protein